MRCGTKCRTRFVEYAYVVAGWLHYKLMFKGAKILPALFVALATAFYNAAAQVRASSLEALDKKHKVVFG